MITVVTVWMTLMMVACGGAKTQPTIKTAEEKALACEPEWIGTLPVSSGKIYSNGIGESSKRTIAGSKAKMAARNNMALKMKALLQSFAKDYMREIEVPGGKTETEGLFVQEITQTTSMFLQGASIVKNKPCLANGKYMVFSLCELDDGSVRSVVKETIVKNEDKLKVLFNENTFKKLMDEKLKEFQNKNE